MAGGRTDARSVLDLSVAGNLRARTAAPVRGAGVELSLPRGGGAKARRLSRDLHRLDAGDRGARLRRRDLCVREPLRASRRADRARLRRPRPRLHLRLSRLELRPERQPQGGRLRGRRQRQGRHGQDLLPRRPWAAQAAHRDVLRPGVRQPVRRRAADRGISRRGGREPHQARAAQARGGDRPLHADAAEQLEALLRERQGHLPREPAAHVLHDVPHQPPVAARRHGGEPGRRQPRELLVHRQARTTRTTTPRWASARTTRASR